MEEEILRLYSGGGYGELSMEQVVTILPKPRIIRLPGAPEGIAGLVSFEDRLIAARYLDGAPQKDSFACAVVVSGADGGRWCVLADKITGGGQIGSVYGSGV